MITSNKDEFIFDGYTVDLERMTFIFHFRLHAHDSHWTFHEKISIPSFSIGSLVSQNSTGIKKILDNISLILGISYWKLFCPKNIKITHFQLTQNQADFWNSIYLKGLGEFYYKNNLNFHTVVQFPYQNQHDESAIRFQTRNSSLVLFGGGKDSIVTGELLKRHKTPFDLVSIGRYSLHKDTSHCMGKTLIVVDRMIDPLLFKITDEHGGLRGHVPMTAIYSFLGLLVAAISGYSYVIASSEESSSYGNTTYLGKEINHQWSKSLEFERLFDTYINEYIGKGIQYFSLLRPIKELRVAEIFSQYSQYFGVFSSCNKNFISSKSSQYRRKWCGKCSKCAFVFLLLAAFLDKKTVVGIFNKNLFDDHELLIRYKEILGLEGIKPFECIGTPEEAHWAFKKILTNGNFRDNTVIRSITTSLENHTSGHQFMDYIIRTNPTHRIPLEFSPILSML